MRWFGKRKHKPTASQESILRDVLRASDFDLDDVLHVTMIGEIQDKYGRIMGESTQYAECLFRPESELPYEKEDIRKAMQALLDFVEGRKSSEHLDADMRSKESADTLGICILRLDDFLPLPASEVPTEKQANLLFGFRYQETGSLEEAREAAELHIRRMSERLSQQSD